MFTAINQAPPHIQAHTRTHECRINFSLAETDASFELLQRCVTAHYDTFFLLQKQSKLKVILFHVVTLDLGYTQPHDECANFPDVSLAEQTPCGSC